MSEQNIWNNTYVLGDSSGTVISAGPGIKITTDEPGVIKVSNDETVLWSGSLVNSNTASLSESITNFERVAFEGYCHNGSDYSVYAEAPVYGNVVYIAGFTYWPGSEFDMVKCYCSGTTVRSDGTAIIYNGQNLNRSGTITKIYGINRKQNGGN